MENSAQTGSVCSFVKLRINMNDLHHLNRSTQTGGDATPKKEKLIPTLNASQTNLKEETQSVLRKKGIKLKEEMNSIEPVEKSKSHWMKSVTRQHWRQSR